MPRHTAIRMLSLPPIVFTLPRACGLFLKRFTKYWSQTLECFCTSTLVHLSVPSRLYLTLHKNSGFIVPTLGAIPKIRMIPCTYFEGRRSIPRNIYLRGVQDIDNLKNLSLSDSVGHCALSLPNWDSPRRQLRCDLARQLRPVRCCSSQSYPPHCS